MQSPGSDSIKPKLSQWRTLPTSIWVVGLVSFFMDASSELIHSLLPVFMVTTLGASMVTVGIIEGVAEAVASVMKIFSGVLSDYLGKRKLLVILGYGLAALSKPIFPLANSISWVMSARFIDRVGKGIRGAPRDALVADLVEPSARGAAYGLRQALDSFGALIGPALAILLMIWFINDIRAVLWAAVVPAIISVVLLIVYVREPANIRPDTPGEKSLRITDFKRLPIRFWLIVLLGAIFTLARFSEAFLILRAEEAGFELSYIPLVMIVMNLFYAGVAYPAGAASDRMSQRSLLLIGLVLLVVADCMLAFASSMFLVLAGAAFWGLHMAFTQGLLAKLIANSVPRELRGSGFGIFNLLNGVALLLASVIAGMMWQNYGASATFLAGAVFATISSLGLIFAIMNGQNVK